MLLRPTQRADFPALLALNTESESVLSPLDAPRLAALHEEAALHIVLTDPADEQVLAFLLAFREGARYDSPNFLWFQARYPRFLYIDRVVVAQAQQGQGLGRQLYAAAFAQAQASDAERLCCEFDIEPPNSASQAFHARLGFVEVGQQRVAQGKKRVSLQVAELAPAR
ncbi:hypothetical protein HNQ51_001342 [Inhella inkyongensis]|uniref:N-acetyltransferase domain-containing protein n=1 Tax=Inhella inkyongensis TaxID=392593 RepID=A0A840S6E4_9BURK|nr:GNAT family N-acetyltransferase [Inhella inkyongensis]MBB5204049.1 hypothetical protein [Inhella inkyongensis]